MTSAPAAATQECIQTLPAHRDVHWYYYIRKSDGAHCWYPGAPGTHVASRPAQRPDSKPRAQPDEAGKAVSAAEPRRARKPSRIEAESALNAEAAEYKLAPPDVPSDTIGERWPKQQMPTVTKAQGK
jgi:hypothetical protein